jgi:CMP-N-acetylneuraminic acid synthetase
MTMLAASEEKVLVVILARGGSKGIPGKNLKKIGELSMVSRAVIASKSASCVSTTLVSSDDPAILAEAKAHGACTMVRPIELAGDKVSSEAALKQAVQAWQKISGKTYQALALLQATSPFTRPADIDNVMEPILVGDADSTVAVVDDYGYFWDKIGDTWGMQYQVRARRQDRTPWKREAGNIYGIRCSLFLKTGNLFSGRIQTVNIPINSWWEIDEPRDLVIAEAIDAYLRELTS